jgi:hypothetical protein
LLALRIAPLLKAVDHLRKGIREGESLSDDMQGARVAFEGRKSNVTLMWTKGPLELGLSGER